MADNVELNSGSGGETLATDDVSGNQYQRVKISDGTADSSTHLQVHTVDAAASTPTGLVALGVRRDADTSLVNTTGDYAPFLVDANGYLKVEIFDGGGSHTVDNAGTFAVQSTLQAGTAEIGKLAAGVAEIGNVKNSGTFAVQSTLQTGANAIGKLAANSGVDIGDVDVTSVAGTVTVDNGGTFAVQSTLQTGSNTIGKLGANSGVDIGDVDVTSLPASTNTIEVVGDVAHDAAAAGNPVLIGSRATASVEGITEVAEADASYVATDLSGVVITRSHVAPEELVRFYIANTDGAEDAVTGLDAGGAGVYNYVTSITVHNSHATTNGFVTFLDGSGGSIFWVFPAPALGGTTMNFNPPLKQVTANTALYVDVSAAITTMYISVQGYQGQG